VKFGTRTIIIIRDSSTDRTQDVVVFRAPTQANNALQTVKQRNFLTETAQTNLHIHLQMLQITERADDGG